MNTYFISYELGTGAIANSVISSIERTFSEAWCFSGNTWIIKTDKTADEIYRHFSDLIEPYGRLLFVAIPADGYWGSTDTTAPEWLRKLNADSGVA